VNGTVANVAGPRGEPDDGTVLAPRHATDSYRTGVAPGCWTLEPEDSGDGCHLGHRHDVLDPVADEPHGDRQRHAKPVANSRRPRNANANWPTRITIDAETGNHP